MNLKKCLFAIIAAGFCFIVSPSFAGTTNSLPFDDNFESYPTNTPLVDGTNGWYASSSDVVVQSDTNSTLPPSGTNAAVLPYYTILTNRFADIGTTNVWVQMDLLAVLYDGDDPPDAETNATAMFYINTNGHFVVMNGLSTTNWCTITNTLSGGAVTPVTNSWIRIHVYQNYFNRTWDLYLNSVPLTNNVEFINENDITFSGFSLFNGATTSYVDNVSVWPDLTAVTNVAASDGTYTGKVVISWSAVAGATNYAVYRNTINVSGSATKFGTETNASPFEDFTAIPGTNYYYWVKADNGITTNAFSSSDSGYRALTAPTGLLASDGTDTDEVHLWWTEVTNSWGYEVFRHNTSVPGSAVYIGETTGMTTTNYSDTTASPGTNYYYWVKATNDVCASALSASTNGYRALSAPTGLLASDGDYTDRAQLQWTANPYAWGYEVFRNTTSNSGSAAYLGITVGAISTNYSDTAAIPGTNYYYWVKATNDMSVSALSGSNSGYRALSAPTGLLASDGTYTDRVQLQWTLVTNAWGYEVWRNSDGSATYLGSTNGVTATNYSDTTAGPGTNYYYSLKATNDVCASALSISNVGYRQFSKPANVAASDGTFTDKVRVTWDAVAGATSYAVYRNTSNDSASALKFGTEPAASPYDDTPPFTCTTNFYWVKAQNGVSTSDFSDPDTGFSDNEPPTPDPMTWQTPPAALSATSISMVATTAQDLTAIQYFFTNLTSGAVSDWQSGTGWTNTGLSVNAQYGYRVKARDVASNETAWAVTSAVYTLASVPLAPTAAALGPYSLRVTVDAAITGGIYNADGNPSNTQYALGIYTNAGNTNYINYSGIITNTAVWGVFTNWGGTNGLVVSNLHYMTTNTFMVKARNQELVPTAFGASTNAGFNPMVVLNSVAQTNNGSGRVTINVNVYNPVITNDCRLRVEYGYESGGTNTATNSAWLSTNVVAEYGTPVVSNSEMYQITSISTTNLGDNQVIFYWDTQAGGNIPVLAGLDTNVWLGLCLNVPTQGLTNDNEWTTLRIDNKQPSVSMESDEPDPTNTNSIPVTVVFSEQVTGFELSDITTGNGTASNFVTVNASNYTFNLIPSAQGTVTADIAADAAIDAFGNGNLAAAQFSRVYDSLSPSCTMTSSAPDPTRVSPIPVTVIFSVNVYGFTNTDITVTNGTVDNFVTLSASNYTFDLTPSDQGTVTADIAANVAYDEAGNGNTAADQLSRVYDSVSPSVVMTSTTSDPTTNSPIPITVIFSENVTGFELSDITTGNGTAGNFVTVNASNYTFDVTPSAGGLTKTVTADIAADVANDAAGNGNTAADQFSRVYEPAPLVATGLSASDGLRSVIRLAWTSSEGAVRYEVWRSLISDTSYATKLADTTATSYDNLTAVPLVDYTFWVKAVNAAGSSAFSDPDTGWCRGTKWDFDGDGRADPWYYHEKGTKWYVMLATNEASLVEFGASGMEAVPGNYDTDGKADIAMYDDGIWYIVMTELGYVVQQFGNDEMTPVPGDYDGDGQDDLAVYDQTYGMWYILTWAGVYSTLQFGWSEAEPIPSDYDGDGTTDIAVYHEASGTWYLLMSTSGYVVQTFGGSGYNPVPGDYDGDGRDDFALYLQSAGWWYVYTWQGVYTAVQFGWSEAIPESADYDGDGVVDLCVFYKSESDATWYLLKSTEGYQTISARSARPSY